MAIAVGVLVGLITLFIIFMCSRKGGLRKLSKKSLLIAGPSDAGKTMLFSQLVSGKVGTIICMQLYDVISHIFTSNPY